MDIEEYKKLAKNKIEADALTRQVRNVIKETKWQKQDMREGFTETFKPLIESQESVKKSIDEQQNKTLAQLQANQLALTEGLNQNRLAITEGLEKLIYEKFEDAEEGVEGVEGAEGVEKAEKSIQTDKDKNIFDFDLNFFNNNLQNKNSIDTLKKYGYDNLPLDFLTKKNDDLFRIIDDVYNLKSDLHFEILNTSEPFKNYQGYELKQPKNKNPRKETLDKINDFNVLSTYYKNLTDLWSYKKEQLTKTGRGITLFNNPHQLLERLELLGGSILAGNNGVIPEFSQIAHLLNQMKVITKKELNNLLKNYIKIR